MMTETFNFKLPINDMDGATAIQKMADIHDLLSTEPTITRKVYASTDSLWTITVKGAERNVENFLRQAKNTFRMV